MGSKEVHISSVVVHASAVGLQSLKDGIARLPGAAIRAESEHGKFIKANAVASAAAIAGVSLPDLSEVEGWQ